MLGPRERAKWQLREEMAPGVWYDSAEVRDAVMRAADCGHATVLKALRELDADIDFHGRGGSHWRLPAA